MTVVAIDGPAGAGKSTVARLVADRLGFTYVDTGSMYRAVALAALESGVVGGDLTALLSGLDLGVSAGKVTLGGRDVSGRIREPDVTAAVPGVSADPTVRQYLVAIQRLAAAGGDVVMEGRDIGTAVCPEAEVKVFLTASLEERARRRLGDADAEGRDLQDVIADIAGRDEMDAGRAESPLRRAPDAITLDTTGMPIEEVVSAIVQLVRERTP